MIAPIPGTPASGGNIEANEAPPERQLPATSLRIRAALAAFVLVIGFSAYLLHGTLGYRVQAGAGIICFIAIAAIFSRSLQSVQLKTLLWGIGLQFALAMAVIYAKPVQAVFSVVGSGIKALISASDEGAKFVFGPLADPPAGPPSNATGAAGGGLMMAGELERKPPKPFY